MTKRHRSNPKRDTSESPPRDPSPHGPPSPTDDDEEDIFADGAETRRFEIKRDVGKRLDVYLQQRLRGISRSRVQKLIDLGGVTLNGQAPKASTTVNAGDVIEVILPAPAIRIIEPQPIPLHILHEDDHYIVINKQAGLIVHPARSHLRGTLINALAHHFKQQREAAGGQWTEWKTRGFRKQDDTPGSSPSKAGPQRSEGADQEEPDEDFTVEGLSSVGAQACRPGIIHRLDRYTTGVMVVAKSDEAHWAIARQFERRETKKAYLALVHGNFEEEGGVIDEPVGKHPTIREAYAIRRDRYGKESVTLYRVRQQYEGYSLVELELKTGRTHQIRVHMTFIGHPLVGDIVYGGEPVGPAELTNPPHPPGARRYMTFARTKEEGLRLEADAAQRNDILLATPALHAALLAFHDPIQDKPVQFTAPLHEPMLSIVKKLREKRIDAPCVKAGYFVNLDEAVPEN